MGKPLRVRAPSRTRFHSRTHERAVREERDENPQIGGAGSPPPPAGSAGRGRSSRLAKRAAGTSPASRTEFRCRSATNASRERRGRAPSDGGCGGLRRAADRKSRPRPQDSRAREASGRTERPLAPNSTVALTNASCESESDEGPSNRRRGGSLPPAATEGEREGLPLAGGQPPGRARGAGIAEAMRPARVRQSRLESSSRSLGETHWPEAKHGIPRRHAARLAGGGRAGGDRSPDLRGEDGGGAARPFSSSCASRRTCQGRRHSPTRPRRGGSSTRR